MIELLVVIAILTLLTSISVPIYRMFSRNDLRDGARTIYTMLRAARIYAMTYNVETAVVYVLDDDSIGNIMLRDTISDANVRAIRAAAIMYRLPDESASFLQNNADWPPEGIVVGDPRYRYTSEDPPAQDVNWRMVGLFTHAPRVGGEFVSLPQGYAILLTKVPDQWTGAAAPDNLIKSLYDFEADPHPYLYHYNRLLEMRWDEDSNRFEPSLEELGMMPVHAHAGGIDYNIEFQRGNADNPFFFDPQATRPAIAHVFTPRGALKTRRQAAERYHILAAPDPWQYPGDRLIELPDGSFRLVGIPIEIHRATGRVRLGS